MIQAGFETAQDVIAAELERLQEIDGVGPKTAEKAIDACREAVEEAERRTLEEAEGQAEGTAEMEFSPDDKAEPRVEDY